MKRVFLYSGQGSQYYQMGRQLYENDIVFHACLERYARIVLDLGGRSVSEVIYDPARHPSDTFDSLAETHFAIPAIQLALTDMLMFRGYEPDIVMGTSLGEYVALTVSCQISVEALFEILALQVTLLKSTFASADKDPYGQGMISVVAPNDEALEQLSTFESALAGRVGSDTLVFTGMRPVLNRIMEFCHRNGILAQRMSVAYAFHSQLMERIRSPFLERCPPVSSRCSPIVVQSCVDGRHEKPGPGMLFDILRRPFDFQAGLTRLSHHNDIMFTDLSPTGLYTRPVKETLKRDARTDSGIVALLSPFGSDIQRLQSYERKKGLFTVEDVDRV
ncbi:Acyl transferase domain in polyketide synthase (PKS) enzymes [Propionibacterium ruminifibrarum]|uniref:Acyl transferase domain in polyketide synthase (PKS) enzymes n=1 Tax=Propionibacterium ruminifibrarum TaxID=1962131 RepID=A0A375I139_9ACTN|nr:acyltransferase domain-containing protein [Propionibacterium ruminifibrarum]SPF68533.1 Acyl transferase domain in polyketide synthase (PKS) enzymes [Propionibacterium ruminifibrarum]